MSLLITHTLHGSGISARMCVCPLPSGAYLAAFSKVFDLTVFSYLLFHFQESGTFQNIKSGKTKQTTTKKKKNPWWP